MVDAHAVKVLGDGDSLVCIAQPYLGSFLLHHHGLCGRRADGLCVGHQVYKGVATGGSGTAAGLDVLLVLKARGAPVAVQIHKCGQHSQPTGIHHRLVLGGKGRKILPYGSDLSILYIDLQRPSLGVHSVCQQHRGSLL